MHTVFVENYIAYGTHGLTEKEKNTRQRFRVDAAITVQAPQAHLTDRVEDSLDYRIVKQAIEAVIGGSRVNLLETLAELIMAEIFSATNAFSATVSVRKLDIWGGIHVPGVTVTQYKMPARLNLKDFDLEDVLERIAESGATAFPIIPEARRLALLDEARSYEYARQPEIIGGGKVREQLASFTDFPQESLFYRLHDDFLELLLRKLSVSRFDNLFATRLNFNDMSLQKYDAGSVGITPHKDGKSRINIVCVFILTGKADFAICDDRAGSNQKYLDAVPGNVIILRGPGFWGSTFQPFHFVTNITEERIVFGLRDKIDPKGS